MNKDKKNIIFLSIGCIILFVIIWKIGATNIYREFLNADGYLLIYAFFIILLSMVIKAYRWNKLFSLAKKIDALKIYFIGMAINQVMPTGSGEIMRAYIAKDKLNVPVGETIAPVMIERLVDTTFLLTLSFTYIIFMTTKNEYVVQLSIPLIILFAGYSLLLKPNIVYNVLNKILSIDILSKIHIVDKIASKIYRLIDTFKDATIRFKSKEKIILLAIILTVISWYIHGLGRYMLILAFGYDIQIFDIIAITAISEIIGAFSFIPGGLGTRDISFGTLLTTFGIPIEIGITIFLIFRIITYVQLGVLAFVSLISFMYRR